MSDTDVYVSPSRVPATIALVLAAVGTAVMFWSFVNGVPAALDAGGSGATPYVIVFVGAAVLVLAGLVVSIVCLIRGLARGVAVIALIVSLVPIVGVIVLRVAATA